MRTQFFVLFAAAATALSGGCAMFSGADARPEIVATRTATAPTLDGKLDDAVWQSAVVYPLLAPEGEAPMESGSVRLLYDDKNLYVGFACDDVDVIARSKKDQQLLYQDGELAEVFIKPAEKPGYWEFYAAPFGNRSSFYYPSRSYLFLGGFTEMPLMEGMRVASRIDGTPNDYTDTDKGWSTEIAIPIAELEKASGVSFTAPGAWTILLTRYNHGINLEKTDYSAAPVIPAADFHRLGSYATLRLRPAGK